jgi:hypothetical protein
MTDTTPIEELPQVTVETIKDRGLGRQILTEESGWIHSERSPEFYAKYAEELIRAVGMRPRDIENRDDVYELVERPEELDGTIAFLETFAREEGIETVEILRDLED